MLQIDPWACIFAAFLILTLPLNWLVGALMAAALHELCHGIALWLLGGKIHAVRLGIGGAVIQAEIPGIGKELVSTLAGPVGSLCLVFFCRFCPETAICGCIQGMFNLLPIYPLDGGRILRCGLDLLGWKNRDCVLNLVEWITYVLLLLLALLGRAQYSLGNLPFISAILLIIRASMRKRPCKRRQIRVQ